MTDISQQGGSTGGVEDLYREVILEHFKSPKNKGTAIPHNKEAEGLNPLCGDHIVLTAMVENGQLKSIKHAGSGCAISQASASMMTQAVKGKSLEEVKRFAHGFKKIFGIEEEGASTKTAPLAIEEIGDLAALEGVKKYPVRIKCAVLSWNTLLDMIANQNKGKSS